MPAHILLAALLATPTVVPPPKEPAVYATIPVEEKHFASAVHFSPDGKTLAFFEAGDEDGELVMWLVLWDVAKKERTAAYETKSRYRRMTWSPDSKAIYAADRGGVFRLDVATGKWAKLFEHDDMVTSLKYLPDTKQLVSSAVDGSIVVWDAAKDKRVKELKLPEKALAIDAQPVPGTSKLAVVASCYTLVDDGPEQVHERRDLLYLADLRDGTFAVALDRLPVSHGYHQLAAPSSGGEYAFADPVKKGLVITDATTGKSRTVTDCPVVPLACRFSPSDRYLFVGGCEKDGARFKQSGAIAVYDLTTEKWVGQWVTKGVVMDMSYSAATNLLTCTSGDKAERQITVWEMKGVIDPAAKPKKKD
jgi:WD40 repeat protein